MEESIQKSVMVVLVLSVSVLSGDVAVTTAEGLCNMTMEGMDACRPSISGSTPMEPSAECCAALANADLGCLCSYRNSPLLPAFGIDPDLAMQLPLKCNLTPPGQC